MTDNEDVRPQKALSVEDGLRGGGGRLSYDVAAYRMIVDDEILPVTIDNVTLFRNVAKASHTGLEASARTRSAPWLTLDATYAYARFVLDDIGAFGGNRLPGIPPHTGTLRAGVAGPAGWHGHAALVAASSTFVGDANVERAGAYGAISGGIGYRVGSARFYARGENLGNARYTNRVQVNDASGFYSHDDPTGAIGGWRRGWAALSAGSAGRTHAVWLDHRDLAPASGPAAGSAPVVSAR